MSEFGRIKRISLLEGGLLGDGCNTNGQTGSGSSLAWPNANRAIFVPVRVAEPVTIYRFIVGCGTTAGNNIDVGIYDQWGNRIYSSGAIARVASAEIVDTPATPIHIGRGRYYLALAHNGTNNIICHSATSAPQVQLTGVLQMESAYTLPATATFSAPTSGNVPLIGAAIRRQ